MSFMRYKSAHRKKSYRGTRGIIKYNYKDTNDEINEIYLDYYISISNLFDDSTLRKENYSVN